MSDSQTSALQTARKLHFLIALLIIFLDRASKWLVVTNISLQDSLTVLPGFFRLTHLQNNGIAFDLFSNTSSQWKAPILVLFSLVAMAVVSALLWKNSHPINPSGIGLSLVLGGVAGNLWDRLMMGHVVDFLDFNVGSYHWPAFNVADSAIVVGALLLAGEIVFAKTPAEHNAVRN